MGYGPARVGRRGRDAVQAGLERRDERVERDLRRARKTGRRHEAAAHLLDDLLPQLALGAEVRGVNLIERQVAGLEPLVVTGNAVGVEERAAGGGAVRGRLWGGGSGLQTVRREQARLVAGLGRASLPVSMTPRQQSNAAGGHDGRRG